MLYTSMTNEELLRQCSESENELCREIAKRFYNDPAPIESNTLSDLKDSLNQALRDAEAAQTEINDSIDELERALRKADEL